MNPSNDATELHTRPFMHTHIYTYTRKKLSRQKKTEEERKMKKRGAEVDAEKKAFKVVL